VRPVDQQIILVTGATDGLGRAVAIDLAKRGATVLVHGRNPQRIEATMREVLAASSQKKVRSYRADFESLADVRALAGEILKNETQIDVLVNNAGIGGVVPGGPSRRESRDGIELRFAVNYLAPYLLTKLLLPLIVKSAPARIVNVSSIGQHAIDFDDVMLEHGYTGFRAYCQSKLAQILMTVDLADDLKSKNVMVTALHPSTYMPTKMVVASPLSTIEEGVRATVRLVVDSALDEVTGKFFDVQRETNADAQAYDTTARQKLRAVSEKLIADHP
jgi:NAD(P)-dependent dehydrogenase (short-subunit alcohol dehydrogenase family)